MAHFTNEFGQHATVEKIGEKLIIRWELDKKSIEMIYQKGNRYNHMHIYDDKHGIEQTRTIRTSKREYDFWMNIYEQGKED